MGNGGFGFSAFASRSHVSVKSVMTRMKARVCCHTILDAGCLVFSSAVPSMPSAAFVFASVTWSMTWSALGAASVSFSGSWEGSPMVALRATYLHTW